MDALETMDYKGTTIEIHRDEFGYSPREDDNLGTMVCFHRRYVLGDEQPTGDSKEWLEELACSLDPTLEDILWHWEDGPAWAIFPMPTKKPL